MLLDCLHIASTMWRYTSRFGVHFRLACGPILLDAGRVRGTAHALVASIRAQRLARCKDVD